MPNDQMPSNESIDRYLKIEKWAKQRYTDSHHRLIMSIGKRLSRYCQIENLAAAKYLGCTHLKER